MRFMLTESTIRYIYDTQHLNINCILLYSDIFVFRALLPLKHTCYYFNQPTPYLWTLTLSILFYLPYIRCLQDRKKRNYSRLSFDYIAYFSKNTGKRCIFVIYIHKGMCKILIFILLRFGLSHR